ncbi:unknown [[Mannheimia] succiniciproducens MBEL55E]|uniref:Uncharacterized protein n=1 Tax=Mannheimia succiniciproducens (strain KCTC 0769BP / MBEL55E) TaxID=221988 RepID=Q65R07_MANSM|nr:unknown [[Mannheimia] succiniciproducens MBEL55E]
MIFHLVNETFCIDVQKSEKNTALWVTKVAKCGRFLRIFIGLLT